MRSHLFNCHPPGGNEYFFPCCGQDVAFDSGLRLRDCAVRRHGPSRAGPAWWSVQHLTSVNVYVWLIWGKFWPLFLQLFFFCPTFSSTAVTWTTRMSDCLVLCLWGSIHFVNLCIFCVLRVGWFYNVPFSWFCICLVISDSDLDVLSVNLWRF